MGTLASWQARIDGLARAGLRGTALGPAMEGDPEARAAFARDFADDFGHRRAVDPPLLAWSMRVPPWREPDPSRLDVRLWHALHTGSPPPESTRGAGPLSPEAREQGIEVWTEIELASLQALWWHAKLRPDPTFRERALSLARWLMAELQPDNATNRPWAAATFAELAAAGDTDAALYADTLLHNCQVSLGKPDLLSTVILRDAALRLSPDEPLTT